MSEQETENVQDYGNQFFNQIDIFIDKSFEELQEITKNKVISIEKIESTIQTLKKRLDYTSIDNLILNNETRLLVINKMDIYLYLYLLLLLSFEHDLDELRKLLIKNEKIGSFQNDTKNTAIIIEKSQIIQNFVVLVNNEIIKRNTKDTKDTKNKKDKDKEMVVPHINKLKEAQYLYDEFITNEEQLVIFSKETPEYKHYILKVVILLMYQNGDKINIFKILENEELSQLEYTYVEVVDTLIDEIDYATVESLFTEPDDEKYKSASFIYELLNEYDNQQESKMLSVDHKINELFNKNILIPITDEFLRYHKDSEKYDKITASNIDSKGKTKKDDTKIKYIVTKINKLSDYYNIIKSRNKVEIDNVEKLLYPSMAYRKAVIINELEEQSIINKILNQGKTLVVNEYYEDLLSYRKYPYINFKESGKDIFQLKMDETNTVIRYCNFEFMNADKYPVQYKNNLQIRTAGSDTIVNIVGIAVNPKKINYDGSRNVSPIICVKLKNTMDLSGKANNGYLSTLSILKKKISQDLDFKILPYWIFNKKHDTIKTKSYENLSQLNHEEYFKFLLGKIYDDIVIEIYQKTISLINENESSEIYDFKQIINQVQDSLFNISKTDYYNEIMGYLLYKKIGRYNKYIYDKNENNIPGLNSKLIKSPVYVDTSVKEAKIIIKKEELLLGEIKEEITNEEFETALCQHQISWTEINYYKKKDTNKFTQLLYEFIKKYSIDIGYQEDVICKSCFESLNIKKYTSDSFDSNTTNLTLVIPLETDLEKHPEYDKFSKAIKNMDKIIEKIASIVNITSYMSNALTNKYRRQTIVKNTIDLITLQFSNFDVRNINMKRERLESANKLYGINKDKSEYYIFEMDNNLFTFSSKETDKYKKFKNNNIYAYMIFLIISELNFNQILLFSYDKIINYAVFDKFSFSLFDGLKIRINNGSDIRPVTDYKLLCYVIYYFTSILIKYGLWFFNNENLTSKPNNINPQAQKNIINTIFDLINSILEINTRKTKSFIYEMISTRFLTKLKNIYDNTYTKEILDRLSTITDKKIQIVNNKIIIKSKDQSLILSLEKKHTVANFGYNRFPLFPGKFFITTYIQQDKLLNIMTNDQLTSLNKEKKNKSLQKIYENFNDDGSKRSNPISSKNIDDKTLEKHFNSVINLFLTKINNSVNSNNQHLKEIEKINTENNNFQINYNKEIIKEDIHNVINNLIDKMEKIIGSNININNSDLYLNKKVFIIDHDHIGNIKKEPLVFTDSDNKILIKKNDNFFKCDVFYYVDKTRNITVYYHLYELYLLGYKESNSSPVQLNNTNNYIKIKYSVKDQLLYLGHNNINFNITDAVNDNSVPSYISNVIRTRINNLKNIVKDFQTIIYQIKNKYNGYNINPIVKEYNDKFKSLNYYNTDGDRIFEDWNTIVNSIYFIPLKSNINIGI